MSPPNIWPTQTPAPTPPTKRVKRRKPANLTPLPSRRDDIFDLPQIQAARQQCEFQSGNDVYSCFPTADTVIPQHQWAGFVWNSRQPDFTQTNLVNIYLFHADSGDLVLELKNQTNPTGNAGWISKQVNDAWFGDRGKAWSGQNISYPFYWIVQRSDKSLDGTEHTQPVFSAVQTTYLDSVASSIASVSSIASASSASAASLSSQSSLATSPSGTASSGSVQSGSSSSSFPHWAIAVIVVLGFLAIATSCLLAFFILRRVKRRNDTNRNSMESSSPMMAHVSNSPASPLLAGGAVAERQSSVGHHPPSVVSPDGASTISRVGSVEGGPFSGADAAIMADAFRKALRKPDFAGRPVEEGESPENVAPEDVLLNQHLAEEGRDIRSVSSSRGVKVETLSDSGETAHDMHDTSH